jgi:hypothetical protein
MPLDLLHARPCDHLVQFYRDDARLVRAMVQFIASGLHAEGGVIVIATPAHLHELEKGLRAQWIALDRAKWEDRYIALDAQATLDAFMVDGWPDRQRFDRLMGSYAERARRLSTDVRAFGEMVRLLMARGEKEATVRLEHLWTELCMRERISLLCGYPQALFDGQPQALEEVRAAHSGVLPA